MKPANVNLTIYQGSTFRKTFTWKAGSGNSATPVNITDFTFFSQARDTVHSSNIILDLSLGNGIEIVNAVEGIFQIVLSAEQTSLLSFKSAVFDLEAHALNGDVYRILQGEILLVPEVTR